MLLAFLGGLALAPQFAHSAAASAPASAPTSAPFVAAPPDLMATGPSSASNEGLLWVARIIPGKPDSNNKESLVTRFYVRQREREFEVQSATIPGRAVAIAGRGNLLAVLMEDGSWSYQSAGGRSTIPSAFPASAGKLLTIACDDQLVYAIARSPGGAEKIRAATTTSTTAPTSGRSSPAPATNPAGADMLSLVVYRDAAWSPVSDLPKSIAASIEPPSLVVLDNVKFVLARPAANAIELWRLEDTAWLQVGQATIASNARNARLVSGGTWPTVLVTPATAAEPDRVLVFDGALLTTRPATAPSAASRPLRADITLEATRGKSPALRTALYAYSRFRSIVATDDELTEQGYDPLTLAAAGKPISTTPREEGIRYFDYIKWAIVIAGMIFIIIASVRRREQIRQLDLDPKELPLAPIGVRLLAGLIDGIPVIAALVYSAAKFNGELTSVVTKASIDWVQIAAVCAWLILTTAIEALAGRSLGKMICGLQIVSLDGAAPTRWQLLTRNLLRVVDVGLQFIPLLLVPFSPLRQRAGDAAAGTLVITTAPVEEKKEEEEAEE
jgi:uncharacterized RDD family membrane protein YckC